MAANKHKKLTNKILKAPSRRSHRLSEQIRHEKVQIATPGAQQDSGLLNLPAELRDRVYEFVLIEDNQIIVPQTQTKNFKPLYEPGLLRTCTQLRSEGVQMYYASNTFACLSYQFAIKWLSVIGPDKTKLIKRIHGGSVRNPRVAKFNYADKCIQAFFAERTFARAGGPLEKDVYHIATPENGETVFLNPSELKLRMSRGQLEKCETMEREMERQGERQA